MTPRLSIVIPFYNVEKYIAECLDSVYHQDIPEDEYEVICVNDASPDHSRDIVFEYQKKHSNLILVEHEVNKKLGAARNTGRRIAKGKYLWNVDSDDMITPNCLREILAFCEEYEVDILCISYKKLLNNGKFVMEDEGKRVGIVSGIEFVHQYGCSRLSALCPVWRYVLRKDFLDDNNIFSPSINMGEDVPFSFKSLFLATKVAFLDDLGYIYRLNNNSLTGSTRVLSPETLYEKCFENTKLILDDIPLIPSDDIELTQSCTNVAKYTFSLWRGFYNMMGDKNKRAFRLICRKNHSKDRKMLKHFLSRYKYYNYLLWMFGIDIK